MYTWLEVQIIHIVRYCVVLLDKFNATHNMLRLTYNAHTHIYILSNTMENCARKQYFHKCVRYYRCQYTIIIILCVFKSLSSTSFPFRRINLQHLVVYDTYMLYNTKQSMCTTKELTWKKTYRWITHTHIYTHSVWI